MALKKEFLIYTAIIVFMAFSVNGLMPYYFDEYNDRRDNSAFIVDGVNEYTNVSVFTSITHTTAASLQPLIADMNADEIIDILIPSGNYINAYRADSKALLLQNSFSMNVSVNSSMSLLSDADGNGLLELVVLANSKIYELEFNNSFSVSAETTITDGCTPRAGVRCVLNENYDFCIFVCQNSTGSPRLIKYDISGNSYTSHALTYMFQSMSVDSLSNANIGAPPIYYGSDGHYHTVLPTNVDGDSNNGIGVFDLETMTAETSFSSDGYVDDITGTGDHITDITVYNLDAGGNDYVECVQQCQEICNSWLLGCVLYLPILIEADICASQCDDNLATSVYGGGEPEIILSMGGADYARIAIYDTAGTLINLSSFDEETGTSSVITSNIVLGDIYSNNDGIELCTFTRAYGVSAECVTLHCIDDARTVLYDSELQCALGASQNYYWYLKRPVLAADMTGDGYLDIITGSKIFDMNTANPLTSSINISSDYFTDAGAVAIADLDLDGLADICANTATVLYCAFSPKVNEPPELLAPMGLSYSPDAPLCVGTCVNYTAAECLTGVVDCNYNNDVLTDGEYLATTCGQSSTITDGTGSIAAPFIQCCFNNTGDYAFYVYLRDYANQNDQTQYQYMRVSVRDGNDGITCNIPCAAGECNINGTSTVDGGSFEDDDDGAGGDFDFTDIDDGVDLLTFGNETIKILMSLFIIANVLYWGIAKQKIRNLRLLSAIVFLTTIGLSMINMLSWFITLFLGFFLLAMGLWLDNTNDK